MYIYTGRSKVTKQNVFFYHDIEDNKMLILRFGPKESIVNDCKFHIFTVTNFITVYNPRKLKKPSRLMLGLRINSL